MNPSPPGPRGYPLIGMLPHLRENPLRVYLDAAERYGDFVHMKAGAYHGYVVCNPDDIKHVLQDNYRNYHKSPLYDRLKAGLGNGLLTSEDDFWLRQRRLAQPAFHRQRLAALAATMAETTRAFLDRWRAFADRGEAIDVVNEMMRLTQDIIVLTMFSTDLGSDAEVVNWAWPLVNRHVGENFWSLGIERRLPTPRNRRFRRALAELDAVVYRIIERRRGARESSNGDLLSMLLSARDEETNETMSDTQVRDEVMTMLLAGHETTSLALSWAWYLLSTHPAVRTRLTREVRDALGGRPPSFDDLERLPFTRMVFDETVRLYPPAWGFSRQALADDRIGGYRIAKGQLVFMIPFVVHRRPSLWPNPEGFDPERFTPDQSARRHRFAYFPFGGGPRQCIGNQFALMEAAIILAMVVQRYRLDLVPGHPVEPQALITLRPRYGMRMTVHQAA
ncbi:MAG: cytochrome P450 [Vicinamibacterales bacterium]